MRCAWCCNPESQRYEIETLVEGGKEKTVGRDVTVADIMPEILADLPYYRRSGGGVTLSGGEVLAQADFAAELLRECKEAGLHTAIESSGNAPFSDIEKLLPYLDLYLMDIKHMDSAKHKEYTGVTNELILENAKQLIASGVPFTVRIPVIDGVNSDEENMRATCEFLKGARNLVSIELLPYNEMAGSKYALAGLEYEYTHFTRPNAETLEALRKIVESYGIECKVRGTTK
jgi:pyruvate formate lyase activating enzyme